MTQDSHPGSHRLCNFNSDMTKTTEPENGNFISRFDAEMLQWRVGGDACTEKRCNPFKGHTGGYAKHVIFIHGDAGRVSAIGRRFAITFIPIVGGTHSLLAKLLLALLCKNPSKKRSFFESKYFFPILSFIAWPERFYMPSCTLRVSRHHMTFLYFDQPI